MDPLETVHEPEVKHSVKTDKDKKKKKKKKSKAKKVKTTPVPSEKKASSKKKVTRKPGISKKEKEARAQWKKINSSIEKSMENAKINIDQLVRAIMDGVTKDMPVRVPGITEIMKRRNSDVFRKVSQELRRNHASYAREGNIRDEDTCALACNVGSGAYAELSFLELAKLDPSALVKLIKARLKTRERKPIDTITEFFNPDQLNSI